MQEPIVIDTLMHGHQQLAAVFIVAGARTALIETGPKSAVDNVLAGLAENGIENVDYIVVTHVHLDHAGAAGTLARRFPDARVLVHSIGAPHLADPSKLWKSATRIYGDDMERLWGGIDPINPDRIDALGDGDKIDLGGRIVEVVETPGHAWHHHAYLDHGSGSLFTGDAVGVFIPGIDRIRPTAPPPEFDLETAISSIEKIRGVAPQQLLLTHFGAAPGDVGEFCDRAIDALRRWNGWVEAARVETSDIDEATRIVEGLAREALEAGLATADIEHLELTSSYRMNTWGYMRYLDKKSSQK